MSIALERGSGGIGRSGFIGFGVYEEAAESSSSSSIGRNSDSSGGGSDGGDESQEVESSLKRALDSMDALEDSLPIRCSISKFYCGKSKSFTSLADAKRSSSARDLAKPVTSYTRKRKSLLSFCSSTRSGSLVRDEDAGVPKRPASSNRSAVNCLMRAERTRSFSLPDLETTMNSTPSIISVAAKRTLLH